MPTMTEVHSALQSVHDPEIPVLSIVDLGIVETVRVDGGRVQIALLPTFSGCPALGFMADAVRRSVGGLPGVSEVEVSFLLDPVWNTTRITRKGRLALQSFGIAPPGEAPACPYCGSHATRAAAAFGPTRCRSIYYCDSCRNPFEQMKAL
jgi:ring-1,2-phenylacetyl-CoA epoxidase subunit PaaD